MPARGKRHSAFNDFPVEKNGLPDASAPASSAPAPGAHDERQAPYTAGPAPLFADAGHILAQPSAPEVERIERLRPSQMIPDRFQPRRLLPGALRPAFFSGQLDCYQAASQWLAMAKSDSGIQAEVDRLMAMGLSFGEHGQIKPITGSWVPASDGSFIFQIETGERRFWAACLNSVAHALPEEPLLRVEVVNTPTRQRQVLENQHAEAPSDVGRACEVAALILSELGIAPDPNQVDEFDYFRQARQQSMTGKLWDKLSGIMQMTRPRMIQLLNILKLPTPQLDLADRYRVPERVIREVLGAPSKQWEGLLVASIQSSLTSDEVAELAQKPKPTRRERSASLPVDPAQSAIAALKRFTYLMVELDESVQAGVLDELANDLVSSGRAEGLVNLLGEFARLVQIRQQNLRRRH